MKNNIYKEFLQENDFNVISKKFEIQFQKLFDNEKKILLFSEFDQKVHQIYLKNKVKIVQSYFENIENDMQNESFNINEYYPLFLLEDGFDESQSDFFSKYFLDFIKSLNVAINNGFYNEELLDFTWKIFDRIFHECYHCEEGLEGEYSKELNKLKIQIIKIDKEDKHLIMQKIEQFIRL